MKTPFVSLLLFSALMVDCGTTSGDDENNAPDDTQADERFWTLSWTEDFDAPGIDLKNWSRVERGTPDWCNTMSDRADLGYIEDGVLILRGIENDDTASDPSPFLTGGISGKNKRSFKLGRIDVRAKYTMARGFWPAIWLMPDAKIVWPAGGEIDIMEHINFERIVHQSVHSTYTKNVSKTDPPNSGKSPCPVDEYNVYSVELHEDRLDFRINNVLKHSYPRVATLEGQFPFSDHNYYVILSAQLGGSWAGEPEASHLPAAMYVDWVRYYTPKND